MPIEFALGVAVLILPVALLVGLLPAWVEHRLLATVAAQEAARTVAVADDWAAGHAAASALVARIAANHGLPSAVHGVTVDGDLAPGGRITVRVTVRVPVAGLPFLDATAPFTWTAVHTEPVDRYRSFP